MEELIKSFLQKMVDQDNRSTAFPYFYVIRTEVEELAPVEICDETRLFWQESSYDSLEELVSECQADGYSEEEIEDIKLETQEYGIRRRWEKRGMFLTETDAVNHLKTNHYHYSSNAHTYVEHAWRAPELKEFLNALITHFNITKTNPD